MHNPPTGGSEATNNPVPPIAGRAANVLGYSPHEKASNERFIFIFSKVPLRAFF